MAKVDSITPEMLRELLEYNPETGKLCWRERDIRWFKSKQAYSAWNTKYSGKAAMNSLNNKGYRHGTLFGKSYLAHRVAWAVFHGEWPGEQIDHINGRRTDNRSVNMRIASGSQNQHNKSKQSNNTSGYKGVYFDNRWGKWVARVCHEGQQMHLGSFLSPEDAHAAYREAAEKYHGEFARTE